MSKRKELLVFTNIILLDNFIFIALLSSSMKISLEEWIIDMISTTTSKIQFTILYMGYILKIYHDSALK